MPRIITYPCVTCCWWGLRGDTAWDLLAVSDRLLHRDDQVDLLVFAPVDHWQCR
jgi:hypothetical protein